MPELLTEGPRVRAFLREYVRQTKGRWAGEPLELEPWQAEFVDEAFRIDPDTGLRIYQEAYLGIPRKSPGLQDWLRPWQSSIVCSANDGKFEVLASDGEMEHGSNPSGGVLDELWTHKSRKLHTALTTGTGAREQPLVLGITTAGYSKQQLLGEIYDGFMALPGEQIEERDFLTICRDPEGGSLLWWYGPRAGEGLDLEDPEVWKACNPASWITEAYLARQRRKRSQTADEFQRFHLNAWTDAAECWLEPGELEACVDGEAVIPEGHPVVLIVDVGVYHDSSAITALANVDGRIVAKSHVWALHKDPTKAPPKAHTLIKGKGPLRIELLEDHIIELAESGRYTVGPVVYDPRFFIRSAQRLEDEGFEMVEWKQSRPRKVRASRQLYESIAEQRFAYDGDPVLTAHVKAGARNVKYDGWCLDKQTEKDGPHNDALMTLMMGIEEVEQPVQEAGAEWS